MYIIYIMYAHTLTRTQVNYPTIKWHAKIVLFF